MTQIAIAHPEMGVYLGSFLGLGFWSLLDPAGQTAAPLFASRAQAEAYISSWESNNNPADYYYFSVNVPVEHYATAEDLAAANVPAAFLAPLLEGAAAVT